MAQQAPSIEEIDEHSDSSAEVRRARSRSRSPMKARKITGLTSAKPTVGTPKSVPIELKPDQNGKASNGHLSPTSASPGWSWRDISRSPSPLGLIPIHRHWRSFVHRHEVPRKLLHVSIGFLTLWFYVSGVQSSAITPWLMGALIPIATTDHLRHTYPSLNRLYVRLMGAFMRETEYDGWNGVIWYLLGAWIVLGFFPKDVGVMGVLLLSWCDTAASTFGRAYGRYTPRYAFPLCVIHGPRSCFSTYRATLNCRTISLRFSVSVNSQQNDSANLPSGYGEANLLRDP
jgi:diacylglycerol kinase (CTP)